MISNGMVGRGMVSLAIAALAWSCSRGPEVSKLALQVPPVAAPGTATVSASYEVVGDPEQLHFAWTAETSDRCQASFEDPSRPATRLRLSPECEGATVGVRLAVGSVGREQVANASVQVKGAVAPVKEAAKPPTGNEGRLAMRFDPTRLVGIGEFRKHCEVDGQGALVMHVSSRQGDFAGCCARFEPPLNLGKRRLAQLKLWLSNPEQQVHVKLERGRMGPDASMAFLVAAGLPAGESAQMGTVDRADVAGEVDRLCLAVVGAGPGENRIALRSAFFE